MGVQQTSEPLKWRNNMNHKFTFGHGGTENFDEHIAKSIRGYSNLLQDVRYRNYKGAFRLSGQAI